MGAIGVAIWLLFSAMSSAGSSTSSVFIDPGSQTVANSSSGSFTVLGFVDTAQIPTGLGAYQWSIRYDPTLITPTTVTNNAALLGTPSCSPSSGSPPAIVSIDATHSDMQFGCTEGSFSGTGPTGNITLSTVNFTTSASSATSDLDLRDAVTQDVAFGAIMSNVDASIFLGDAANELNLADGSVTVGGPSPTPAPDTDGDGITDSDDNCPNWPNPNQALPPWLVPANDPDCDGFNTTVENYVSTNATLHCGPSAWPPDFNDTMSVTLQDVLLFRPVFNTAAPGPPYNPRFDLNGNASITLQDVLLMRPFFNSACT